MSAPRKFDEETSDRAVRIYRARLRDDGESKRSARRHVGGLLDINPETLRNWVDREDVDTGVRAGVTTDAAEELRVLRKENAELRRANEILKTASAFFAAAELDRKLR